MIHAHTSFLRKSRHLPCSCGTENFEEALDFDAEFTPPSGCVTPGNPYLLHCFPAHISELTDEHRLHFDRIVIRIAESFHDGRPIRRVRIVGHAATWNGRFNGRKLTDRDYRQRARNRAKEARKYLVKLLRDSGLSRKVTVTTSGRADDEPLVDNMPDSVSRTARRNRDLNRRIEVFFSKPSKPRKPKPLTCKSPKVIRMIRSAQIAHLTSIPNQREQLTCLRKVIADALSGKDVDDRFWEFTVVDGGTLGSGHGVKRRKGMRKASEVFCTFLEKREINGPNVSRALWHTHNRILGGLEKLDRFLRGIPSGNPFTGDPATDYTECGFARDIRTLSRSAMKISVYLCYRKFIRVRFKRCKG